MFSIKRFRKVHIYVLISLACVVTLFPILWVFYNSFVPEEQILRRQIISSHLTVKNYQKVFHLSSYLNSIKNSAIASLSTTLISIIVGSLGAYGLTRLKLKGKSFALFLLIFRMLPGIILVIPFYLMFLRMNLLDTYWALILMYLTLSLPLAAWMLRGFFMGIPPEIIEAARLDGCGEIKTFYKIVIPVTMPGIWTTAVITYLFCWNDFLYALIVTDQKALTFLPFICRFVLPTKVLFGQMFAGTAFFVLPVIVGLIFVRKYLTEGFALGLIPK